MATSDEIELHLLNSVHTKFTLALAWYYVCCCRCFIFQRSVVFKLKPKSVLTDPFSDRIQPAKTAFPFLYPKSDLMHPTSDTTRPAKTAPRSPYPKVGSNNNNRSTVGPSLKFRFVHRSKTLGVGRAANRRRPTTKNLAAGQRFAAAEGGRRRFRRWCHWCHALRNSRSNACRPG